MKRNYAYILVVLGLFLSAMSVSASTSKCTLTHTVQPGEWLIKIAREHDLNWAKIAGINHLVQPYRIYPGQVLCLSFESASVAAQPIPTPILLAPSADKEQSQADVQATPVLPEPVTFSEAYPGPTATAWYATEPPVIVVTPIPFRTASPEKPEDLVARMTGKEPSCPENTICKWYAVCSSGLCEILTIDNRK